MTTKIQKIKTYIIQVILKKERYTITLEANNPTEAKKQTLTLAENITIKKIKEAKN